MRTNRAVKAPGKAEFALILRSGEGQFVEFKESASDSLAKAFSAFANAEGGRVYVGVADNGEIRGLQIANRLLSQIRDTARHCDPPIGVELVPFKFENHDLLMIEVFESGQKPHGCSEGYFLRTGPNSQKMNRDELARFLRAQSPSFFDETPCPRFRYPADFSVAAFNRFLDAAKINPSGLKREDLLVNIGVAERQGKSLVFNNAGVIFFAKRPTLFHIQSKITCLLFMGTQRIEILDRKDLDGGVIANVEDAMAFLKRHLPLRYEIKTLKRKEILAVPEDALREAVLNAVIHRDYFSSGVVMVEIHRNKVEIVSPGGLVPGLTIETLGGRSLPRNPRIAELFLRADEVEKAGTGIGRIRSAVAQAGLEPPVFSSDAFFSISFPLPATPGNVPAEHSPSEGTKSGLSRDQVNLSPLGQKIAGLLRGNGQLSAPRLQELMGKKITLRSLQRELVRLAKAGIVIIEGKARATLYRTSDGSD
jgi:ATP-dependent DNA helicase RecG